jgi:hypothetical protein
MYIPSNAFVSKSKIDVYSFSNIKFSIKKKPYFLNFHTYTKFPYQLTPRLTLMPFNSGAWITVAGLFRLDRALESGFGCFILLAREMSSSYNITKIQSNAFVSKSKIDVYSFSNIKFSIKKKPYFLNFHTYTKFP